MRFSYLHNFWGDFMLNLDKTIRLARAKGWSNAFLAKKLGRSSASLFVDWRKGKSKPSENDLKMLADMLDTTTDYLTDKTDKKEKPLVNGDEELTKYLQYLKTRPEMRMLFDITKSATKEDVEKAVKIIEAFLKKE